MPRPATKTDLLAAANTNFEKLWGIIDSMSETERSAPFNFNENSGKEAHWKRDKNVRDVLVHLYEWHQLLLNWVRNNQRGEAQPFLPAPYNWKTYGEMNVEFWKKHQSTPYSEAERLFRESHEQVMALMGGFTSDELFSKGVYSWAGTNTVGTYCVSATSSHYDWAIKKLKAHLKVYRAAHSASASTGGVSKSSQKRTCENTSDNSSQRTSH